MFHFFRIVIFVQQVTVLRIAFHIWIETRFFQRCNSENATETYRFLCAAAFTTLQLHLPVHRISFHL